MKKSPVDRALSLLLSVLVTVALFGAVDQLASREPATDGWAGARVAPQG